jgi:hypothetical protein
MVDNGFGTPRSVWELLGATFDLYRRYPWLFLVLAAGVIVPYQLVVLAATGSGAGVGALLAFLDWTLVGPLVSALHVHAVDEARMGGAPRLGPTFAKGLRALPLVAFVTVVSTLGIGAGFFLLIVPGVILTLRWAVVSQAAAIEREGGFAALGRSGELTSDRYGHVFGLLAMAFLIGSGPLLAFNLLLLHDPTTAWSFLAGLALQVFSVSISALATALLYFDLRVRSGTGTKAAAVREGDKPVIEVPDSLPSPPDTTDSRDYSDADRPRGWYIDPEAPKRMRYWGAGGKPQWTGHLRTPFKLRRAWREKADAGD